MGVYQPSWIADKHNEAKWQAWKHSHPEWEARSAEIGVSEAALKAWVIGATSYVPGAGKFADYDHGPLAKEIKRFWGSAYEEMPFGTGTLIKSVGVPSTTGAPSIPSILSLAIGFGVISWAISPTFVGDGLADYQAAELLKEAWYAKADEVLASCSKANIPLAELYAPSIKELEQKISAAVTAHMMRCGLMPQTVRVQGIYETVRGVEAYSRCKIEVTTEDVQSPVTWPSGLGGEIQNLNTWE